MAYKCDSCRKGVMVGKQHKHHRGVAGGRWLRRAPKTQKIFKPNLHAARIFVNGAYKKVKLCTKCLRLAKESMLKAKKKEVSKSLEKPQQTILTA